MEKNLTLAMASYNKGPYIERCIKSISEQTYLDRTEIIIVDDCSTDDSVEILKYAANKYRVPITLYINEHNLGMAGNGARIRRLINKEFFTSLDLDDYYIHPERLERAVKFLMSHPDHAMHGCNFYWEMSDGTRRQHFPSNLTNFSVDKYSQLSYFHTSSATFRNFLKNEKLSNYLNYIAQNRRSTFANGDPFRNFCAVHYGKVYFDNFLGSVYYMQTNNGVWGSLSKFEQILSQIGFCRNMAGFSRDFFNDKESALIFLQRSAENYFLTIDYLHAMMNDLSAKDFHLKPSMVEDLNLQSDDIPAVVKYLLDQADFLKSIGAGRKLSA